MPTVQRRAAAQKLFDEGNFKDAYEGFRKLALDAADEPRQVGHDLRMATDSLKKLGRPNEIDAFREQAIALHARNWRLLQAAAENYLSVEHYGGIVAGKFERGSYPGLVLVGLAQANDRDRVRALQLLVEALPLLAQEPDRAAVADFYLVFARAILDNFGNGDGWRLQTLTNLAELPDYEQVRWYYRRAATGAPVRPDGTPIYYAAPKTFEAAVNDGERWRWALEAAVEASAAKLNEARFQRAVFLQSQFGEQTMAEYSGWFARAGTGGDVGGDDGKEDTSGTFALHTLDEDETIAKLATGVKRFKLPDEHNYIKLFQRIADQPRTGHGEQAVDALAQVFENRRQYPKAAGYWRRAIKEYGPGRNDFRSLRWEQIVKNWGRFDNLQVQPAGQGAEVDFRFRNASKVHFEAHAIHVDKLLDDVKAYLRTRPGELDWQRLNVQDIGYQIVQRDQRQYVGRQVAAWDLDLQPRERHFDKRITVSTPLQQAGAYLLTAQVPEGNTTQIIVWLADTVLVQKPMCCKPMSCKAYYFVADAVTGAPIPKANLEFFGYRQRHVGGNRYELDTANFAEFTGPDGQLVHDLKNEQEQYQWIITARTKPGRFAFLGFTNVWRANYHNPQYEATKVFAISDRPVYRPKQPVKFKFWVRHAKYDQEDESTFAHRKFPVRIVNPKGDKVLEKEFETDDYGGIEGEYALPDDATLGVYQFLVVDHGGGSFRVEEYKKPEFEVTVEAPKEPVLLGEKVAATIEARYYFGAPVTKAKVKYKVLRTSYQESWFPRAEWDWLYGRGYWWFAYDAPWYPGWRSWGCMRPLPFWWGQGAHQPPEVVADAEVEIGPDGKVHVEIDTAIAKEIHGDQDHQYQIVAEVLDESRRTIVGTGNVMVARKPFTVFTWLDRGYYRAGDVIEANFEAHTLSQQPVQGKGTLKLLKITYDDKRKPLETVVEEWDLDTDAQGRARRKLKAAAAGQYRLSLTLTDAKQHTIEGGYLFTVTGRGFDGAGYRFNHLELVPDLREYRPGDKVKLQINTDRVGGTVLLFVRPVNGVYLPPQLLKLAGRSTIAEIEVTKKDMPNFFVEALTISGGELYSETKEIVVPPEKRVLNVAVEPSAENYRPGQPAEVKVTLTDFFGKPFVGSTALAIYDKSIEYISGGSNVPEIKQFFWKWRRSHYPRTESTLAGVFYNLVKQGRQMMRDLGAFGGSVADEPAEESNLAKRQDGADKFGGNRRGAPAKGVENEYFLGVGYVEAAQKSAGIADAAMAANELGDAGAAAELVQPTVRSNFADTALWVAALTTDGDGVATVKLDMPENLTTWKVRVWGLGHGTKVGQGETEVITRKDLLIRMQAPRFFVEKDEVVLSANVHNYLKSAKRVEVALELDRPSLVAMDDAARTVEVEAGGELRIDWRVRVAQEGEAVVRMKALTDEESDAVEMRFPAYIHGMLKMEAVSGAIRPEKDSGRFEITVPAERRPDQSRLEVRYSPSLAGAMVDALPYLVDYPYGCTEQTLNRFLPTVVTQRILLDMKLDLKAIRDKRTHLNAQEIGDDRERAPRWKRFDRNPVFDEDEVRNMVKDGVRKLTDMQLSDGGWGWFSGWGEHSAPHTTAVVVHGLQLARQNEVALVPGMLERGVEWLKRYQDEQIRLLQRAAAKEQPFKTRADNLDAFVYMVLVDADLKNQAMRDFLYRDRVGLAVYAKAMFGLALHQEGAGEHLAMILRNIAQFLVEDDENQTAYLQLPENNDGWYWYGSDIEAQSYYLKLLARTDPKGEVAARLVKYLLNNRKHAGYWNSTRDTAVAVEALAEFLKAGGETDPELTVEVWLDGKLRKAVEITTRNLFTFDNRFVLEGEAVTTGKHTFELRKKGRGPLYYNGYATHFTLEDDITRAGLEIKVNRKFYKLVKVDKKVTARGSRGEAVEQRVEKYRREELVNLASLKSSDLVEIELEIDGKNDYEYLMFEDMKAAGFEPVDVRSGYHGNALGAYMELRDNRVCFFVRNLARGKHSVAYRLRAEIPGKFSALPTRASAMYAPELKANSDEMKIVIED
ncbi:MAG TPA: MG2 domain-containing protein [Pirellulales bacterium]|nr:MG2 domain-containing protein [Pirellulales bacterium]